MEEQLIYRKLAFYYDLIYSFKNYQEEVSLLKKVIAKHKKSRGNELLEVACGTGKHLKYLKDGFSCTGVDINEGILAIARKQVAGVSFKKANMITLNLHKKYDVITCLFSSIGYAKTYGNLRRTIRNFANHLKPGGVVVIEPWFTKGEYNVGTPHMQTYDGKDIKIARLTVSQARGNVSVMDMNYLVAEKNEEVKHFVDRHELGMFDVDKTLDFMVEAGLQSAYLKKGLYKSTRGLYIGVKK